MKNNAKTGSKNVSKFAAESLSDDMLDQASGGFINSLHPCNGCDAFTNVPENENCFGKKLINQCPRGLKIGKK